jgi:hypothetical protein
MGLILAIIFDFMIIGLFVSLMGFVCLLFKKQIKEWLQDYLEIKTDKIRGIKDGTNHK